MLRMYFENQSSRTNLVFFERPINIFFYFVGFRRLTKQPKRKKRSLLDLK